MSKALKADQLALAEKAIATLEAAEPDLRNLVEVIALVGSCSEGFSTVTSDIDIILVTKHSSIAGRSVGEYLIRHSGEFVVSAWILCAGQIQRWLEDLKTCSHQSFSLRELELRYKIANALPVVGNDVFAAIVTGEHIRALGYQLREYYRFRLRNSFEDVYGAQQATDILTAAVRVKDLVRCFCEIELVELKDAYPKEKWLLRRAQRSFGPQDWRFKALLSCEFSGPSSPTDWEWIENQLRAARRLMSGMREPIANVTLAREASNVDIEPWCFPFKVGDRNFALCGRAQFELDACSSAVLDVVLQPMNISTVVHALDERGLTFSSLEVSAAIESLAQNGLIRKTPLQAGR